MCSTVCKFLLLYLFGQIDNFKSLQVVLTFTFRGELLFFSNKITELVTRNSEVANIHIDKFRLLFM